MTSRSAGPCDVVVVGARGRLGSLVCAEAERFGSGFRVVARIGRGDTLVVSAAHVVVDLATAGATAAHASACANAGVPYVVATTGQSADDERALDDAAKTVPVLSAANLSVSAHVAVRLVREAAARLASFDVEVVEIHHNKKKDAPSGTALLLAQAACDARTARPGFAAAIRRGRDGASPREPGEIGVSAVRGGDVVGEHTVHFFGAGERVDIVHRVTDRAVFARGALAAARFVVGRRPGRYHMSDVVAGP